MDFYQAGVHPPLPTDSFQLNKKKMFRKNLNFKISMNVILFMFFILSVALITETCFIFFTKKISYAHLIYFLTFIVSYLCLSIIKKKEPVSISVYDRHIYYIMKLVLSRIMIYSMVFVLSQMIIISLVSYFYSTLVVLIALPCIFLITFFIHKISKRILRQHFLQKLGKNLVSQ